MRSSATATKGSKALMRIRTIRKSENGKHLLFLWRISFRSEKNKGHPSRFRVTVVLCNMPYCEQRPAAKRPRRAWRKGWHCWRRTLPVENLMTKTKCEEVHRDAWDLRTKISIQPVYLSYDCEGFWSKPTKKETERYSLPPPKEAVRSNVPVGLSIMKPTAEQSAYLLGRSRVPARTWRHRTVCPPWFGKADGCPWDSYVYGGVICHRRTQHV